MEEWKPVVGYEGRYEVSDHGRVRVCYASPHTRRTNGLLTLNATLKGHFSWAVCGGGRVRRYAVHRTVLEAFVGPCPAGMECCHNNGDPKDNRLENLRWDTHSNNMRDCVAHGTHTRGSRNGNAKYSDREIERVRALLAEGMTHKQVASKLSMPHQTVSGIAAGHRRGAV